MSQSLNSFWSIPLKTNSMNKGLPHNVLAFEKLKSSFKMSVLLDSLMVCYCYSKQRIDGFPMPREILSLVALVESKRPIFSAKWCFSYCFTGSRCRVEIGNEVFKMIDGSCFWLLRGWISRGWETGYSLLRGEDWVWVCFCTDVCVLVICIQVSIKKTHRKFCQYACCPSDFMTWDIDAGI